jgi:cytochrome c peroxidase
MHDGRFSSLEQVLQFYANDVKNSPTLDSKMGPSDDLAIHLSVEEQRKIICFLKTLSDSTLIKNPFFSDPFKQ